MVVMKEGDDDGVLDLFTALDVCQLVYGLNGGTFLEKTEGLPKNKKGIVELFVFLSNNLKNVGGWMLREKKKRPPNKRFEGLSNIFL